MKRLEENVANYFTNNLSANQPSTLQILLEDIAKKYRLSILKGTNNTYDIKGDNGYLIISKTLFMLLRLEKKEMIIYHKQGNPENIFEDIDHCKASDIQSEKISGYLAEYIDEHITPVLYVNPKVPEYVNNGFITPELVEARKQTKAARWTLVLSVITTIVSIISLLFNNRCGYCH